jgi:hypothetical protein
MFVISRNSSEFTAVLFMLLVCVFKSYFVTVWQFTMLISSLIFHFIFLFVF